MTQEVATPYAAFDAGVTQIINAIADAEADHTEWSADEATHKIQQLGQQLIEDAALDLSLLAADAFALTMLSIYDNGIYGGGMVSPSMDKLARVLLAARKGEKSNGDVVDV